MLKIPLVVLFLAVLSYAEDVPKKQELITLTPEQQTELLKLELRALRIQAQAAQANDDFKVKEVEMCKDQKLVKIGENWACSPETKAYSSIAAPKK